MIEIPLKFFSLYLYGNYEILIAWNAGTKEGNGSFTTLKIPKSYYSNQIYVTCLSSSCRIYLIIYLGG